MKRTAYLLLCVAAIGGCRTSPDTNEASTSSRTGNEPVNPGIEASAMDLAANPCEDFYRFACGTWLDETEIPSDRARWSRGFSVVQQRNEKVLHAMLEQIADGDFPEGTVDGEKVGTYYGSCMDEEALEGAIPGLKKALEPLAAPKSPEALAKALAYMHQHRVWAVFDLSSAQDFKNATRVIAYLDQNGLGLPDRDYYLKDDEKMKALVEAYRTLIAKTFEQLGDAPEKARKRADDVIALETRIAEASMDRVTRRDANNVYHLTERSKLNETAPSFPWEVYLEAMGAPSFQAVNVTHPPFFKAFDGLVKSVSPSVWESYFKFHLASQFALALPKAYQADVFAFEQALTGAQEDRPRYKKCIAATDGALGESLAQPFIAKTFGEDGKKTTSEMVRDIQESFRANLDNLGWMDDETRQRAEEKLDTIVNKIGYPDRWRDYDALEVSDDLLANLMNTAKFETRRDLAKIGKPVDREEWFMTPPTVNAYYNPLMNEIVFPAGILQPPFFARDAVAAVNFGAIGMVVGHEITHGFDDSGRRFDAQGNLQQWWTESSDEAFKGKAQCVVDQYSSEIAIDDIHVNGELTLGENVADMGGLKLSYDAMQSYTERNPEDAAYRFTNEQAFFLGYAQSWCNKYRPEMARVRAQTDPHSPPFLRVNVPLRNSPDFQEAFSCEEGAAMALPKEQRCEVW